MLTYKIFFMSHVKYRLAPVINTRNQLSTPGTSYQHPIYPYIPLNDNDDDNDVEIKLFPKI